MHIEIAAHDNLPTLQFFPSYPGMHVQVQSFTPSVHDPPFTHGLGEQSLVSKQIDCDTLGLTDGETLGDTLVEGEKLMLTECETLEETLEDCDPLGLTDGETLEDILVEGERLMLIDCETLIDSLVDEETLGLTDGETL